MRTILIPAIIAVSVYLSVDFSQKKKTESTPRFHSQETVREPLTSPLENILKHHPGRNKGTNGHDGDPVNLIFIGTASQIRAALITADWTEISLNFWPALGLGLKEVLEEGIPPKHFPMSTYFVDGRTQDFNWAKAQNLQTRHHFRLWQTGWQDPLGRPVWWGSANFDDGIRWRDLSHKADPDVDKERTYIQNSLTKILGNEATSLIRVPQIPSQGANDRNYPFQTDGRALVVVFH